MVSRLGQGGMGSVFLAEAPGGRRVAVKVIRPEYAHDEQYRARFRSEVTRARQVPPFCTAEVLDADPEHATPYLVVEYVDGPSLSQVVGRDGPLAGGSLHGVAVGVAAALAAIHGAGVIHRDLKPGNVLFALGTPKVIDFGIARPLETTSFHTRAEEVVGTLAYMAPERLDPETDRLLTPAVDVFAWGAVVVYAGTGRTPFGGDSPAVTAARILTQPPRVGDLPPYLTELVVAALEKDPANRPAAPELLDRLLVPGAPSAPPLPLELRREAEAAQRTGRPGTRRRRVLAVTAAAVATAAVVGAGVGLLGREKAGPAAPAGTAAPAASAPLVTGPTIFDSLRRDADFQEWDDENGTCTYRDGYRVRTRSAVQCGPTPEDVFPAAQNVGVTVRLSTEESCAAIWFRAHGEAGVQPDAYRVAVCPGEVTLISVTGAKGEVPIATAKRALGTGAEHRMLLVADDREAVVSVDGTAVLRGLLTETGLISGRVVLGAVAKGGGRADVTFTDAQLRSGTDPGTPALPGYATGDARFTAGVWMLTNPAGTALVEAAEYPTGEEYCRRFGVEASSPRCAADFVPVLSGVRVNLPVEGEPELFNVRVDGRRCPAPDPVTRAGRCAVSSDVFSIFSDETSPWPALVTVRGGKVVAVAKLDVPS